jgi:hypothetical protein
MMVPNRPIIGAIVSWRKPRVTAQVPNVTTRVTVVFRITASASADDLESKNSCIHKQVAPNNKITIVLYQIVSAIYFKVKRCASISGLVDNWETAVEGEALGGALGGGDDPLGDAF